MLDLSNRQHIFYWQTDRSLSPQDFERVFLKRHETPTEELLQVLKNGITFMPIDTLEIIPADENVVKGNVNIVRKVLINGKQFVVRMHPKGVKNGYFYVEKVALDIAKLHDLPVPQILEVHEAIDENDMDFVVLSVVEGQTMDGYFSKDKSNESNLVFLAGRLMAKLHDIKVEGFGCFDNQIAKKENNLVGLHRTNMEFMFTALEENLQRLISLSVSTPEQTTEMMKIMRKYSFEPNEAAMVHNDFADWNLLTDGISITGILDWDECCGGDPIADLACWSMFFTMDRYEYFLKGYTSTKSLPEDYEIRFHYYRLRYAISKMALRAKRYIVDKSEFMKDKVEIGRKALLEEVAWFNK